jgi:cytochrome P450 family 4
MGTKINALNGENSEYVRSVKEMCRIVTDRCLSVLKLNDWSFALTRDYYLQKSLLKLLHGFTSDVITRRKETMEDKDYYETKKKMAFLDLLLNIRKQDGCFLSDEEIRQEVDTFLFAVIKLFRSFSVIQIEFILRATTPLLRVFVSLYSALHNIPKYK